MREKQMYYFLAVKEIVELFAEQEIGSRCEINIPAVISYIESMKFVNDSWGLRTKEEIYQLVTDDILSGYPVWNLLNMSEWTKSMVEREFTIQQQKIKEELKKKYKCYTCKHFVEQKTSIGILKSCNMPRDDRFRLKRRGEFEPVKRCNYYELYGE